MENKDLLILRGDGVENKIFNLLNIFSVSTVISEKIKEATLVSSRRWSLKHSSNKIDSIEIIFTGLRKGEKLYEELLINNKSEKKSLILAYIEKLKIN